MCVCFYFLGNTKLTRFSYSIVYITQFILLDSTNSEETLPSHYNYIILTSDGRSYFVRWGRTSSSLTPIIPDSNLPPIDSEKSERLLFDEKVELEQEAQEIEWVWSGVCFHSIENPGEKQYNGGKIGSCIGVNEKMALVSVGCEEFVVSCSLSFRTFIDELFIKQWYNISISSLSF